MATYVNDLEISLEEAVKGYKPKIIQINTLAICDSCGSLGLQKGSTDGNFVRHLPRFCTNSVVSRVAFVSESICPTCHGEVGKKIENLVAVVMENDEFIRRKSFSENPAGVDTKANQLRLAGKGAAGENGAPAGDLYVVIHVR